MCVRRRWFEIRVHIGFHSFASIFMVRQPAF